MSEVVQSPNFDEINIVESAILDADADAGQPVITLVNTQGISAGDRIYVGQLGTETGEILTVLSISGKNVTFTTNLTNDHREPEPAYKLYGDQQKLYRAANIDGSIPDDTSFSLVGSAVNIDPDQTFTLLTDPGGGSDYWYKTTYFNSITLAETNLAQSVAQRGGGYGHYVSIEDIRIEAGLQSATELDDSIIAARRDQAESEINGRLAAAGYTIPLQTTNGASYTPPLVENIARLLSAGYVLMQDYGATTDSDTKNGTDKVKAARDLLDEIQKQVIVLLDVTGAMLGRSLQVSGWPDDTTAITGTDGVHGEPFQITMDKRF